MPGIWGKAFREEEGEGNGAKSFNSSSALCK